MNPIAFNIPGAEIVYNHLYPDMPLEWRDDDLLFVTLKNANTIDVGWYPACDPKGWFKITLSGPDQNAIDWARTPDMREMIQAVQSMASGEWNADKPVSRSYQRLSFSSAVNTNSTASGPPILLDSSRGQHIAFKAG
jgi:hypothetical protein